MKLKLVSAAVLLLVSVFGTTFAASADIAAQTVCTQYHTVQRGETLYRISRWYGVSMSAVQAWNNIPNANRIFAGQTLCVQQITIPCTYVVQRGDWLSRIARSFGVDVHVLARINNLSNPNLLHAGQVLVIPDVTIQ